MNLLHIFHTNSLSVVAMILFACSPADGTARNDQMHPNEHSGGATPSNRLVQLGRQMTSAGVSSVVIHQNLTSYESPEPPEAALEGGVCQISDSGSLREIARALTNANSLAQPNEAGLQSVAVDVRLADGRSERFFMEPAVSEGIAVHVLIAGSVLSVDSSLFLVLNTIAIQKCGQRWPIRKN